MLAAMPAVKAQTGPADFTDHTLAGCIQYALTHQPVLQQSLLDEDIVEKQIQSRLADWYPQLSFNYNFQHNFSLPVAYFSNNYVRTGANNTSGLGLGLTQNIFNRDVMFASRTKADVRTQAKQNTQFNKIDVAASVSKAFYDVLLTKQQLAVLTEAMDRLGKSQKDAVSQYKSGVADKTDYQRATITLNNTRAQYQQVQDQVRAKLVYLKQLMGYPDSLALTLQYDTARMEQEATLDTNQAVHAENRIEYSQLQTQLRLQQASLQYNKAGFLPTVSAFGNYNVSYLSNEFGKIYNTGFNNSNIGIQLSFPIFQGNKRVAQIRQAELQTRRIGWDMALLKSRIQSQFEQSMANYKGAYWNFQALKENVQLASDVYRTLNLQYQAGIRTYLDVIVAESDLRTSELNYYNALYQLLQAKVDVEKSMGTLNF